jgi:hypothetical protein
MASTATTTFGNDTSGASRLEGWCRAAATPRNSYLLLALAAAGYSVGVALPLAIARALPMPDPYLRIANADYFFWGIFFYAPVIVVAWLLAAAVMFLVGRGFGSKADFGDVLRFSAFVTGLGTFGTLLSDLVTSPLRALGAINEQAWELSVAGHGWWFGFLWVWMALYLVLFLVGYPVAVRVATNLSWTKAITTGVIGFACFQGFEYIFIR